MARANTTKKEPAEITQYTVSTPTSFVTEEQAMDIVSQQLNNMTGVQRVQSGQIQSANFVAGSAGWQIAANGSCEFSDGTFRGSITATGGDITGNLSVSGSLDTGDTSSYHASFATIGGNSGLFIKNGSSIVAGIYFIGGGILIDSTKDLAINSTKNITLNVGSGKQIRFSVDSSITSYVDDTGIH